MTEKTIKSITPHNMNRCQQAVEYTDGSKAVRCFSPANPQYCKRDGAMVPIDLHTVDQFQCGVGPAVKTTDNVTTVGVRTDGVPHKLIGFRPDDKQDGQYQLELTLDRVTINGIEQDLTLHAPETKLSEQGRCCIDVGACQIYTDRRCGRILTPLDSTTESFEIAYTGTFTGCHLEYVGTETNGYWGIFADDTGKFLWRFSAPLFVGADYQPLRHVDENGIQRSLDHNVTFEFSDNGDGTYSYKKKSIDGFNKDLFPSLYFVDAQIVYASTTDGDVSYGPGSFSECHGASVGTFVNDTGVSDQYMVAAFNMTSWAVFRSFFEFDCSGLSGNVIGAEFNIYGYGSHTASVYIQEGTQGSPLALEDYDAFTGTYFSYKSAANYSITAYNTFTFNALGISKVNIGGTTKLCVRCGADYNNSAKNEASGGYFSDNTGTDKDPYLEITFPPPIEMTVSFDSMLKKTGITESGAIDSMLMHAGMTNTIDADAILSATRTGMTDLDGQLLVQKSIGSGLDAMIQQSGLSRPTAIDGLTLMPGILVGALIDAALMDRKAATSAMHAMIAVTRTIAFGIDAALMSAGRIITSDMDAALQARVVAQCVCDALFQNPVAVRAAVDALLIYHGDATVAMDAIIYAQKSIGSGLDALLVANSQNKCLQKTRNKRNGNPVNPLCPQSGSSALPAYRHNRSLPAGKPAIQ